LDSDRLLRLHRSLLAPENLVVGVVGDVDPDRIISLLGSMFEDLPAGRALDTPRRAARWPKRRRTLQLLAGREQAQVVIAWRGSRFTDAEYGALRMAEELLAGQGGRLFMELRERRSLAYSLSAEHVAAWDPGFFAVGCATDPARLEEAAAGLLGEVERLAEEGPAPGELDRARQRFLGERARGSQRAHRRAYRLAFLERIGLDPAGGHARALLEDVDGAAIQAALEARLSEGCIEVQVRPDPAL
jgi:zinc protease